MDIKLLFEQTLDYFLEEKYMDVTWLILEAVFICIKSLLHEKDMIYRTMIVL